MRLKLTSCREKIRTNVVAVLAAFTMAAIAPASGAFAQVTQVYDGSAANSSQTKRSANSGLLGRFTVSSVLEINQFGMNVDLTGDGNVNFVIFEDSTLVYQSGSVAFTDTGYQEVLSPSFSLTLNPGSSYFVGATTDIGASFGCCGGGGTQGVITSIAANANPSGFLNPTRGGIAGAHIDVNLYSGGIDATVDEIQTEISHLMQERARHLVAAQPDLIGFLSGTATGAFNVDATSGHGTLELATSGDQPVWARVQGNWSENGDIENSYFFGVAGAHYVVNPDLLLGAMVQFDSIKQENGETTTEGDGYLTGPYFVAKLPEQTLYIEGRYLIGQTDNAVTFGDDDAQDFETDRTLALLKVAGQLNYGDLTLTPSLSASHLNDIQGAFTDDADREIAEQSITVQNVELGLDVAKPFRMENGELTLTGGLSGIWSKTEGTGFAEGLTPNFEGERASVHLGTTYAMDNGVTLQAAVNYDGIGTEELQSFGLVLGMAMEF
jgi:hypothetical protein